MKLFMEVADVGASIKVAKTHSIPQQTLSSMLGSLENELGTDLFQRKNGQLVLTEEGEVFYRYCEGFFSDMQTMVESKENVAGMEPKKLRIVAQNNIAQSILPNWLGLLMKNNPHITPDVQIKNLQQVVDDVAEGKADIGFVVMVDSGKGRYPELSEDLNFSQLFSGRPYYWVNKNNPISKNGVLTGKLLKQCRVIFDVESDEELMHYIYQNLFHVEENVIRAVNKHMMLKLVQDDMAICPDIKRNRGGLTLEYLMGNRDNLVALPLSAKDGFHFISGYLTRKDADEDWIREVTGYLSN